MDGDQFADALRFRRDFGLSINISLVQAVFSSPHSSLEFGTPLADYEVAAVHRRLEVEAELVPLAARVAADPRTYAGLALEPDGATVDVLVADFAAVDMGLLQGLLPVGARLNIRSVQYSANELADVQIAVREALPQLQDAGLAVASVGIDVKLNRVVIKVENPTATVAATLTHLFGPAIATSAGGPYVFAACTGRANCGSPMKGGLSIQSNNGVGCTSGFLGRTVAGGAVYRYVLTAGHCLDPTFGSGLSATWNHPSSPNTPLGTGASEDLYSGTSADVGAIYDSEAGTKNLAYISSNTSFRSIFTRETNLEQYVGRSICRSGLVSGWTCGVIVQTDSTYVVQGVTLNHQWLTSFPSAKGDSGAPMLCDQACGITSAGDSSTTTYSTMDWIAAEAGVRPCYSASCG